MLSVVLLLACVRLVVGWPDAADCRHTEAYHPDQCIDGPQSSGFKYTCLSNNLIARTSFSASGNPCTSQTAYYEYSDAQNGVRFTCDSSKPMCPTIFLKKTYFNGPNCATPTGEALERHMVHQRCVYEQGMYKFYTCTPNGNLEYHFSGVSCADAMLSGPENLRTYTKDINACYMGTEKLEFNCTVPTTTSVAPTTTVAPLSAADCRHTQEYLAGECYYEPHSGWDAFKYQCLSNSRIALDTFSGRNCNSRFGATLVSHTEYTHPLDGVHFTCDSSKPECPTRYFKQMYYTAQCRTLTDSSERPVVYDRCVYADGTYMFYTCFSEDVLHKYYSATSCVDAMGGSPEVYQKDTCYQNQYKYDFDCTTSSL